MSLLAPVDRLGRLVIHSTEEAGKIMLLLLSAVGWMFRPPLKMRNIMKQMEFVGVKSIFVVVLTGIFTGMVLALQSYHGFRLFSAEGLVGGTVALSMTRELGPVLTSVNGDRAGRIGNGGGAGLHAGHRADRRHVCHGREPCPAPDCPPDLAGVLMVPLLTVVSDFMGIVGGYFVGVEYPEYQ